MDGDQAEWFFIGNAEQEASTQTLPADLPSVVASAATQTVQDPMPPVPPSFDRGYIVAAVAVAGVMGVIAGRLLTQKPAALPDVAPTPVPASDPKVEGLETASPVPESNKEWPSAVPSLPTLEPELAAVPAAEPSCPVAEIAALGPERHSEPLPPPPKDMNADNRSRDARGAAVAGLGLSALLSAGLLSRCLCRGMSLKLPTLRQAKAKPHLEVLPKQERKSLSKPGAMPVAATFPKSSREGGIDSARGVPLRVVPVSPCLGTASTRVTQRDDSGSVDIGFEILRHSRMARSSDAPVYIFDGVVRPSPPTSSRVFRMLPKQ
mmetsp:Transcript_39577/g.88620  ORF Transcript_39577/g.88620 Transcript_39577/m.88620 type:complete len:321 (+) Transcript_39577:36-998(+)